MRGVYASRRCCCCFSAAPPFQHVNPIACVTLHHSSVCSLDNYQNIDHEKSSRKQHMVQLTFKIEFLFQIRNFYFFDDFWPFLCREDNVESTWKPLIYRSKKVNFDAQHCLPCTKKVKSHRRIGKKFNVSSLGKISFWKYVQWFLVVLFWLTCYTLQGNVPNSSWHAIGEKQLWK